MKQSPASQNWATTFGQHIRCILKMIHSNAPMIFLRFLSKTEIQVYSMWQSHLCCCSKIDIVNTYSRSSNYLEASLSCLKYLFRHLYNVIPLGISLPHPVLLTYNGHMHQSRKCFLID